MGLRLAVLEFEVFAAGASEWRCLRREESAPTGRGQIVPTEPRLMDQHCARNVAIER